MPFIEQRRRDAIYASGLWGLKELGDLQPGDRCYFFYKQMVDEWKKNPKWTTAHEIYKNRNRIKEKFSIDYDDKIAIELAWQVFFQLHVMPYELKKREENGDI